MSDRGGKLGLIVNPVAGLGGRVGLKGSDGPEIQRKALELGAVPCSIIRAAEAIDRIRSLQDLEVITWPGAMGEEALRQSGLHFTVTGSISHGNTTPEDTRNAAEEMKRRDVDLLLFAGGDGTARDIYDSIGEDLPTLGIPTGVKIHSAVFATTPVNAGNLAALYLQGRVSALREAEVLDIDEEALRAGDVSARLYGYLRIPFRRSLVQSHKTASTPGEKAAMEAIALSVTEKMEDDTLYILGPGTTTRAVMSRIGLDKTLVGVDVVENRQLMAADVRESELLELTRDRDARIVVTPVGGQGCILGRGNQQISPEVIKRIGRENIIVISTAEKLNSLRGRPLWVDTGDREIDALLSGHLRVVTGYNEEAVCSISSG